jgi:hypothetical protein
MTLVDPESVFWDLTPAEVAARSAAVRQTRHVDAARQDRDDDVASIVAARRAAWVRLDGLMRASRARRVRDLSAIGEVTRLARTLGYLWICAAGTLPVIHATRPRSGLTPKTGARASPRGKSRRPFEAIEPDAT